MSQVLFFATEKLITKEHLQIIKDIFYLQNHEKYGYCGCFENKSQQNYFGNDNVELGYWGRYQNVVGYSYYFDCMYNLLQQPLSSFANNVNYNVFEEIFCTMQSTIKFLIKNNYEVKLFIGNVHSPDSDYSIIERIKLKEINYSCKLKQKIIYIIE